jgi:hypothetical protein
MDMLDPEVIIKELDALRKVSQAQAAKIEEQAFEILDLKTDIFKLKALISRGSEPILDPKELTDPHSDDLPLTISKSKNP